MKTAKQELIRIAAGEPKSECKACGSIPSGFIDHSGGPAKKLYRPVCNRCGHIMVVSSDCVTRNLSRDEKTALATDPHVDQIRAEQERVCRHMWG